MPRGGGNVNFMIRVQRGAVTSSITKSVFLNTFVKSVLSVFDSVICISLSFLESYLGYRRVARAPELASVGAMLLGGEDECIIHVPNPFRFEDDLDPNVLTVPQWTRGRSNLPCDSPEGEGGGKDETVSPL